MGKYSLSRCEGSIQLWDCTIEEIVFSAVETAAATSLIQRPTMKASRSASEVPKRPLEPAPA